MDASRDGNLLADGNSFQAILLDIAIRMSPASDCAT